MSDETNGSNARFERIEQALTETVERLNEISKAQMQQEFAAAERRKRLENEFDEYRQGNEEWKQQMRAHVSHLTELVRIFGDKTFEFDEKLKQVKEAL